MRTSCKLALGVAALSVSSVLACGGSASETPPPLEPDPRNLVRRSPADGANGGEAPPAESPATPAPPAESPATPAPPAAATDAGVRPPDE